MYDIMRYVIDDVLMGPSLAPFTTTGIVILVVLSVAGVVAGGRDGVEEED